MDNIKILKKIGEGAFAECFLCRNNNNRLIAIKKSLYENTYEGIKYSELREIYCLLKLQSHPNIINLYEISINNNYEYILIMKYVNLTLDNFINNSPLNIKYIISFISQMLSTLYFMNLNNIIHTDLKSSNILVKYKEKEDDIHIYVIDFGSANIENITQKYTVATTYLNRAPEVYNYDCKYDSKIDIWSFGMIVYNMIFGKNFINHSYFHDKSDIEKLRFLYDIQNSINNLNFDIKLKYFLLKIFTIDPQKRPNVNELILLFEELFKIKVKKETIPESTKISLNVDNNFLNKLHELNSYISSRLNYINLLNLDVAKSIYKKLSSKIKKNYGENEIIFIVWFINYQFIHSDVDYDLNDFIPVYNSFCNKNFTSRYFCELTYDILDDINFNLI